MEGWGEVKRLVVESRVGMESSPNSKSRKEDYVDRERKG